MGSGKLLELGGADGKAGNVGNDGTVGFEGEVITGVRRIAGNGDHVDESGFRSKIGGSVGKDDVSAIDGAEAGVRKGERFYAIVIEVRGIRPSGVVNLEMGGRVEKAHVAGTLLDSDVRTGKRAQDLGIRPVARVHGPRRKPIAVIVIENAIRTGRGSKKVVAVNGADRPVGGKEVASGTVSAVDGALVGKGVRGRNAENRREGGDDRKLYAKRNHARRIRKRTNLRPRERPMRRTRSS